MELENIMNSNITEISRDDDLLSLFQKCESVLGNAQVPGEPDDLMDLELDYKQIKRGYNSDEEIYRKSGHCPKSRQIINKKQQRKKKRRTKIYIKALESKVSELQTQIERLKKLNKINKEYIHRLNESEHVINGYFVGRQQVIEKLQVLNGQDGVDSARIMEEIASLRLRQGVFGKDRIKAVNYYFREMVEMVLPEIQKYVIKTAIEKEDFFDVNYLRTGIPARNVENWRKAMLENIGAQIKQKNAKEYLYNNRQNIIIETRKFNQILVQLGKMKCQLTQQAKKLEQVLDNAHKFMRPVEVSKSLCYIDKYRFEKNISLEHTFSEVFEQIESKCHSYEANRPFCLSQ